MEYRNLQTLIDIKITNFINEYKNVNRLFENSDVKNGLLHPGEYGVYKELLVNKLFSFALPKKFSYGTGFIINSSGNITSQCDIVLYDERNAPFLEIDNTNRFFPQEVVYGIGEIKSKLTKKQLLGALIKLAHNKKIRQPFYNADGTEVNPEKDPYQSIFTFLICDEVIDWNANIALEIKKEYIKNDIETPYWFNAILSLKNGVIAYHVQRAVKLFENIGCPLDKSFYTNEGIHEIAVPCFGKSDNIFVPLDFYTLVQKSDIIYVKEFLVLINEVLVHLQSYYPDPVYYLYKKDN